MLLKCSCIRQLNSRIFWSFSKQNKPNNNKWWRLDFMRRRPLERWRFNAYDKLNRLYRRLLKRQEGRERQPIQPRSIYAFNLRRSILLVIFFFSINLFLVLPRVRRTINQKEVKLEEVDIEKIKEIELRETPYGKTRCFTAIFYAKNGQQIGKTLVINPNGFLAEIEQMQKKTNVISNTEMIPIKINYTKESNLNIVVTGLRIVKFVIIAHILYKFRRGINPTVFLGKSMTRKIIPDKDIQIRFKDVAGMEQAKLEITEFVDFLKNKSKFKEMGAKIPRGALLTGPPGTGKTMLAKACAGQAGVPFFYMSGSEFVELFVGVGASRVRQLFSQAKSEAPSIIFIDQIDTVGKKRQGMSNQEKDSTLNQLLVQMDGFKTDQNVIVIAATNRKDVLDSALIRPGRFDRLIEIELPDLNGRREIFQVHLAPIKLEPTKTIEQYAKRLATLTPGFSGADIANLCNEAAILAARRSSKYVEAIDFEQAAERVMAGLQKRNLMTPENKKIVSYHEAGHAVTAWFLEGGDPLVKVTIIPRSKGSLGYAQYLPRESALKTKQQLLDRVVIMLGGRIAQYHFFGRVTTGASDDLQKVFELTRAMVTQFGMSNVIGNVGFEHEGYINRYSNKTSSQIDEEIRKIVREAETRCRQLIKQKSVLIEKLAEQLMKKESLTTSQISQILGQRPHQSEDYKNFLQMAKSK